MAVDELLLAQAAEAGQCAWRFYRWEPATLSLGYFQAYQDRMQHATSLGCPAVRRLSGGGAIVHDREITYSVALPALHPLASRHHNLYEAIHRALIDALGHWGIAASLCPGTSTPRDQKPPFLCFQRRSPGDLLWRQAKIAGSAQRRRRGALLQHGSLLLGRSPAAPELPGLDDLATRTIPADALQQAWLEQLAQALRFHWFDSPLADDEIQWACAVSQAVYHSTAWTEHRRYPAPEPRAAVPQPPGQRANA